MHTQAAMEVPEPYLGTQSSSLSIHAPIAVLNTEDTFESYKLVRLFCPFNKGIW